MPRYLSDYKTNSVIFTSNGTFTAPPGVSLVYVTVVGGGGGGGGGSNAGDRFQSTRGGGGGGGGTAISNVPILLSVTESVLVTIGQGGYGGAGFPSGTSTVGGGIGFGYDGGPGGSTSFGVYLTAFGGTAGRCNDGGQVTMYGLGTSSLGAIKDGFIGETRSLFDTSTILSYGPGAGGGSGSTSGGSLSGGNVYVSGSIWTTPYRGGSGGLDGANGSFVSTNLARGGAGGGGGGASQYGTGGNGADGPDWSGSVSNGTGSIGTSGSMGYGYGSGGGGGSAGAVGPLENGVSVGGPGGAGAWGRPGMCVVRWIL